MPYWRGPAFFCLHGHSATNPPFRYHACAAVSAVPPRSSDTARSPCATLQRHDRIQTDRRHRIQFRSSNPNRNRPNPKPPRGRGLVQAGMGLQAAHMTTGAGIGYPYRKRGKGRNQRSRVPAEQVSNVVAATIHKGPLQPLQSSSNGSHPTQQVPANACPSRP